MECPKCGGQTMVTDCRPSPDGTFRRRRKCVECDDKFTTKEVIADDYDGLVDFAAAMKSLLAMVRKLEK